MRVPLNDLSRLDAASTHALEAAFARVLATGSLVLGPEVAAFEREFAAYCGVAHGVGVASGSDALELALRAAGVGPGDEVVAAANAAMYGTLAVLACGATPVYADVDPATLTMAPTALRGALSSRTRAVLVTHLYGRLADMAGIRTALGDRGVMLIEDCAQAHGARSGGTRAGAFGDLGCFSFYPTKNLGALGDGGAVVTDSPALAGRVRALRQYGWDRKYHVAASGGRNSRLDEVQAAWLRLRLPGLDAGNARRRAIVAAYATGIRHPAITVLPAADEGFVGHLAVVRTPVRDALRVHLERWGVGHDVHYPVPDHWQPVSRGRPQPSLPVTERACAEVLSLPCFPTLATTEVDDVIDACNAFAA
ncbi:MAG: DegT/DnrJ/EryC1/StrS family aminotransferase [Casimicrobiaceae bacterium]